MTQVHRVLPPDPVRSLDEHIKRRGGRGLEIARKVEPDALIDEMEAAGLRGRGGAGFPTHIKWRTVRDFASALEGTTVVVNGAEGEPGTYKDRTILTRNPYEVIEGALIAALAVGADRVVFGLKRSFGEVVAPGAGRHRRDGRGRLDRRHRGRRLRGARRVPVRRGDGPARGHRRALPVPPPGPALPPGRRRGGRDRTPTRRAAAASPATSRWPASSTRPAPRPPWSTTSRPWPTCPASSPGAATGSAPRAPTSRRAPSCARCRERSTTPGWPSS